MTDASVVSSRSEEYIKLMFRIMLCNKLNIFFNRILSMTGKIGRLFINGFSLTIYGPKLEY